MRGWACMCCCRLSQQIQLIHPAVTSEYYLSNENIDFIMETSKEIRVLLDVVNSFSPSSYNGWFFYDKATLTRLYKRHE